MILCWKRLFIDFRSFLATNCKFDYINTSFYKTLDKFQFKLAFLKSETCFPPLHCKLNWTFIISGDFWRKVVLLGFQDRSRCGLARCALVDLRKMIWVMERADPIQTLSLSTDFRFRHRWPLKHFRLRD